MTEIKLIDEYYYLEEDKELFSGLYDGLYIMNGVPLTGISLGSKCEDEEFMFREKLSNDSLEYVTVYDLVDYKSIYELKDFTQYEKGILVNGKYKGVYFKNGKLATDTIDGLLIINGKIYKGVYFKNGKLATDTIDGLLIINGKIYTGELDGKTYSNGLVCNGYYDCNITNVPNGYYRDGIRLIGEHFFDEEYHFFPENSNMFNRYNLVMYKLYGCEFKELLVNHKAIHGATVYLEKDHPFRLYDKAKYIKVYTTNSKGLIELYKCGKKYKCTDFTGVYYFNNDKEVYFKNGEDFKPTWFEKQIYKFKEHRSL